MNINRIPERGKTAIVQSLDASFNGAAFYLERMKGFSIVVDKTGTAAGTFTLEASNNAFTDLTSGETNATATWIKITGSDATVITGSDQIIWHSPESYYEAVRIVWTRTSGTGSASIYSIAKAESP